MSKKNESSKFDVEKTQNSDFEKICDKAFSRRSLIGGGLKFGLASMVLSSGASTILPKQAKASRLAFDAVQANSNTEEPKEPVASSDIPDTPTEGVKISEALISGTNTQTKPLKQAPNAKDFVGYDSLGKKLSLPERCAICKRIKTEEEKAFLRQCKEQGGKTKACGCLTLLCSVKVE